MGILSKKTKNAGDCTSCFHFAIEFRRISQIASFTLAGCKRTHELLILVASAFNPLSNQTDEKCL